MYLRNVGANNLKVPNFWEFYDARVINFNVLIQYVHKLQHFNLVFLLLLFFLKLILCRSRIHS